MKILMKSESKNKVVKVLLVDDDPDIHLLVKEYLKERGDLFSLESVTGLSEAFDAISHNQPDVVLLDLSLTERHGLETFDRFSDRVKDLPVVIFTSLDDESTALEAVNKGAQDYLVKGHVSPRMLSQVLRYAVERYRTKDRSRNIQLMDVVTGIYNKRGFSIFAEQHLRSSGRNLNGTTIYLLVLEGLSKIEKKFGEGEAHHALKTTAEILKESFRGADILARFSHHRFVVMPTISSPTLSRTVMSRIKSSQTYYNSRFNLYQIVLRWQVLHFSSEESVSIDKLMEKVDQSFDRHDLQAETSKSLGSDPFRIIEA